MPRAESVIGREIPTSHICTSYSQPVPAEGIEPPIAASKAVVLPLDDTGKPNEQGRIQTCEGVREDSHRDGQGPEGSFALLDTCS